MATDLTGIQIFPYYKAISVTTVAMEILLPSQAGSIEIGSSGSALWIGRNGCSDGGAMPVDKMFIPAANVKQITLGRGLERNTNIFVATQTGSTTVYLEVTERR